MGCLSCVDLEKPALYKPYQTCLLSLGKPCDDCSNLDNLGDELREAQEAMDKVLERHRKLRSEVNRSHDRIILRLSPEVVSHIFEFCMPSANVVAGLRLANYQEAVRTRFNLCAVCQVWRRIAQATHRLWTSVFLHLGHHRRPFHIDLVNEWLNRSGTLPLTIHLDHIHARKFFRLSESFMPNESDRQVIDALNRHSSRWQNLWARLPAAFFALVCGGPCAENSLKALALRAEEPGARFNLVSSLPAPSEITIHGLRLKDLVLGWDRLMCVKVTGFQLDECLKLLNDAPNIEEFLPDAICEVKQEYFALPTRPVAQERLKKLLLHLSTTTASFLDHVKLPSLTDLDLINFSSFPLDPFLSFLRRSSCNILRISVHGEFQNGEESLMPLLRELRSLKELDIEISWLSNEVSVEFLEALAKASNPVQGGTEFLPNLRYLRFVPWRPFPWHLLAPIFGALDEQSNPRQRPLQKVHIYFVDNSHDYGAELYPDESARAIQRPIIIDQESMSALRPVFDAGIDLRLVDLDYTSREQTDIYQMSVEHHQETAASASIAII